MKIREIGALHDLHEKGWAAAMGKLAHPEVLPFLSLILRYQLGDERSEGTWPLRCERCGHEVRFRDETAQAQFGRACLQALRQKRPEFLRHLADLAEWFKELPPGWTAVERVIAVSRHFKYDNIVPSAAEARDLCWKKLRWNVSAQEIRRWFKLLNLPLRRERRPSAKRKSPPASSQA